VSGVDEVVRGLGEALVKLKGRRGRADAVIPALNDRGRNVPDLVNVNLPEQLAVLTTRGRAVSGQRPAVGPRGWRVASGEWRKPSWEGRTSMKPLLMKK